MQVHRAQHGAQEKQELRVVLGRCAGLEQVCARIRGQRPVVVLAGTVDARERLFVQKANHAVLARDAAHELHRELVVVRGDVRGGEDRREFVLGGRGFVVLRLRRNAELPKLLVQFAHERAHARLQCAEKVVVQFLPLRWPCAEQGAPRVEDVGALVAHRLVDQEVLLLGAYGGRHARDICPAEELQYALCLHVDAFDRAQEWRFFVQNASGIGAERRGDAQRAVLDKGIARGVPRRIAARLKRRPQPAGGEARRVVFALDELLPRKFHDHGIALRLDECLVLFGGHPRHGLEPMGKMRRTLFDRPILHRVGDHVRDADIERVPLCDGFFEGLIRLVRQAHFHDSVVKHH